MPDHPAMQTLDDIKEVPTRTRILRVMVLFTAGIILTLWMLTTPPGLLGKADAIGYAVCHRIDLRSFHIGDRPLPLCVRCTGMYLGALLGLVYQFKVSPRAIGMPSKRVIFSLLPMVLAFGVDGGNSIFRLFADHPLLYEPNNTMRMVTGTGMGLVIAVALYPAFNQTVWRRFSPDRAINGMKRLGGLVLLALTLIMFVLSENPLILYPLALVSASGVVVLLTMIYGMMLLMIFRAENRIDTFSQLVLPFAGGFTAAWFQIAAIDLVRRVVTGTWEGFHVFLG
jgi:uncharacterized membrane protein